MDDNEPITDLKGTVPSILSATPDWMSWFGLNVDATRVPPDQNFWAGYTMKHRDERFEPITEAGALDDGDWAAKHGCFIPSEGWRGFIPMKDYKGIFPCPEFLDFDMAAPTITSVTGRWYIATTYAITLASRLVGLDELINKCANVQFFGNAPLPIPPSFDNHALNGAPSFNSNMDLQRVVGQARRALAERMGWLAWFRAAVPQPVLQAKLSYPTLQELLRQTAIDYRRRGYIIRLADSWAEANIAFWLTHDLPIFYCWRLDERVSPQLAQMHPWLIGGSTAGDQVALYDVEEDDEVLTAARMSKEFDDFFQPKQSTIVTQHLSFEIDASFYIIDFQGWGRRRLPEDINSSMYTERFLFLTENSTDSQEGPKVIFWRWRKKDRQGRSLRYQPALSSGEMDKYFLREILKDEFAPRKGRVFDEETGELLATDDTMEDEDFTPFADHRRDAGGSGSESEYSEYSESSTPLSSSPAITPSIFERLGITRPTTPEQIVNFSTVATVTSWRNAEREAEDRARVDRQQDWNVRTLRQSSRSRSPRRPLASDVPPHERPLTLFCRKLREIAPFIAKDDQQFCLPSMATWNPTLMEKGVLVVTEARSEVCLRYLANIVTGGIRHIGPLLKFAIERRLSFRIAIPESDIRYFAPTTVAFAERISGNFIYSPDFVETPLAYQSPTVYVANYIARIGELLKRPHAPAFIGAGGACSWIAQRWGGEDLINKFMFGPSIQTTVFRRGASDIKERKPKGLLWDEVSGSDVNLLFGFIPDPIKDSHINDRWIYPPPDVIDEFCDNCTGEWNWVMETIYVFISDEITNIPCKFTPKSRGGWKKWLRTYNGGPYTPTHTLTEHQAADIMKGLALAGLPKTWNYRSLSTIYLPESAD